MTNKFQNSNSKEYDCHALRFGACDLFEICPLRRSSSEARDLKFLIWCTALLTTIGLVVFMPIVLLAQATDTSTVNILVGDDTDAPSVPDNLEATAVNETSILLGWDASTDDFGVDYYRVFRDGGFIATTSATSYLDTGLSAGTTYAYNVSAVDTSGNESSQSATSSATTDLPEEPEEELEEEVGDRGSSGSHMPLQLVVTRIIASQTSVMVTWNTARPVQSSISWGRTPDYELGSLSKGSLSKEHTALIENLTPNTRYYFRVEVVDAEGIHDEYSSSFTTYPLPDTEPPANASHFTARPDSETKLIELSWKNPGDIDFDKVRIVRSDIFYPQDELDGKIVFEGNQERFTDKDVEVGKTYYYTIFTRDTSGNFSSGAVAQARIPFVGEEPKEYEDPFAHLPVAPPTVEIEKLRLGDFYFMQDGTRLPVGRNGTVRIDASRSLTIAIDYEDVPEVLKTIAVTLTNSNGEVFTFLLRINEDKSAYEATIGALEARGFYDMLVTVLDYQNRRMKNMEGQIAALADSRPDDVYGEDVRISTAGRYALPALLLIGIGILLWRRRDKDENSKKQSRNE